MNPSQPTDTAEHPAAEPAGAADDAPAVEAPRPGATGAGGEGGAPAAPAAPQGAPPPTPPGAPPDGAAGERPGPLRRAARALHAHHLVLAGVLATSAVLNTHRLAKNGYANIFYSAAVKSMLRSLHNFLFVSFDPAGFVTVDKPPLGAVGAGGEREGVRLLAAQPAAAGGDHRRDHGRSAVPRSLSRRLGPLARPAAPRSPLAVFPSFVAVSRDERRRPAADPADGARLRRGAARLRNRPLALASAQRRARGARVQHEDARRVSSCVPGIALAYFACAPGSPRRRAAQLLVAGALMARRVVLVDARTSKRRPPPSGRSSAARRTTPSSG